MTDASHNAPCGWTRADWLRISLVPLIVAAGILGASRSESAATPAPPHLPTVLVAGDSMAADVSDDLARLLNAKGTITTVETHPGSGLRRGHPDYTYAWLPRLRAIRDQTHPDTVVLFLGTNDAWWTPLSELGGYEQAVQDVLRVFPRSTAVFWILPNDCPDAPFRGQGARITGAIRRQLGAHAIDARPAACGQRIPDFVHLTIQGQRDVAAQIARELP